MRVWDWKQIKVVDHIKEWNAKKYIIKKFLDPDLETIIESGRSLGIIQPRDVLDFYAKPRSKLRNEAEKLVIQKMDEADSTAQVTLSEYFGINDPHLLPDVHKANVKIERLPWIGYRFYCNNPACNGHNMMVIDWEAQELFRKYMTIEPVRKKFFTWMLKERELYFIVGNTWRFHKSFMIIGVFYPPKGTKSQVPIVSYFKEKPKQKRLFDFNKNGESNVFK